MSLLITFYLLISKGSLTRALSSVIFSKSVINIRIFTFRFVNLCLMGNNNNTILSNDLVHHREIESKERDFSHIQPFQTNTQSIGIYQLNPLQRQEFQSCRRQPIGYPISNIREAFSSLEKYEVISYAKVKLSGLVSLHEVHRVVEQASSRVVVVGTWYPAQVLLSFISLCFRLKLKSLCSNNFISFFLKRAFKVRIVALGPWSKWSAFTPSTLTLRVQIPLKSTVLIL